MDILSAVILGIIQGATEFIPVSSSAHICLARAFFGLASPDCYPGLDVVLHAGTLFAVLFAYRRELPGLAKAAFTAPVKLIRRTPPGDDGYTVRFVFIATLPIVAAVLLGLNAPADRVSRSPFAVGCFLIMNGLLLLTAQKLYKSGKKVGETGVRHALGAGLFQAAAVFPGISRSGSMIAGGMLCGIEKNDAVRLSFLCSIPAVIGACVFKAPEILSLSPSLYMTAVFACGFASAALSGLLSIKLIKTVSGRSGPGHFSIYCFAIGAAAIVGAHG